MRRNVWVLNFVGGACEQVCMYCSMREFCVCVCVSVCVCVGGGLVTAHICVGCMEALTSFTSSSDVVSHKILGALIQA